MVGWFHSYRADWSALNGIRKELDKKYPMKHYAFHRVIPNHFWLQIVAMTVIRHCHQFNWPDDAKRPEYPTHHQTFLDWPLPVQLSQM